MKRIIILLGLALYLTGCGFTASVSAPVNTIVRTSIGSPLLSWESGGIHINQTKSELVYSGMTGSVLKLQYREYHRLPNSYGWYAASAFSQDLTYDTALSKEIAFQNARLELIEFDNSHMAAKLITSPIPGK